MRVYWTWSSNCAIETGSISMTSFIAEIDHLCQWNALQDTEANSISSHRNPEKRL